MRNAIKVAKEMVRIGHKEQALEHLRQHSAWSEEFAVLARAAKWTATVDWNHLPVLRVAFLGGGTLDQTVLFARYWMLLEGYNLEAYLPPFDTWRMETLQGTSGLYQARPEIVWFFTHSRDFFIPTLAGDDYAAAEWAVEAAAAVMQGLWSSVRNFLPGAQIVQNTVEEPAERVFGHLEAVLPGGRAGLLRNLNAKLTDMAQTEGALVFDYGHLANLCGLGRWHNPAYWYHSKHPYALECTGKVSFQVARTLGAIRGAAKKVLVLDLDNTLWGGVVGDDGVEGIRLGDGPEGEAFSAFQSYLKELSGRGIVLAVASKNEEDAAKKPFLEHPGMRLALDDIAVFKAGWGNKADSIRCIADTLNLGLNSFVFIDDNPAERELIRKELPLVAVPELPTDVAEFVPFLDRLAYFETIAFSEEDGRRSRMYRENFQRSEAQAKTTNIDDYLKSLEMRGAAGTADAMHLPRMAQLINKSNQFHPTTTRYSEAELRELANRDDCIVRWFSLKDRFGDYGLIAALVLRRQSDRLIIDTWAMSCRVLERGMEEFILRKLIAVAEGDSKGCLIGLYFPTAKNKLVAKLYERLGFEKTREADDGSSEWRLPLPASKRQSALFVGEA